MARLSRGFTLIELMIVVAIMGILMATALPAYHQYMTKSRLTEATTDLDAAKIAATEAYQANANTFPTVSPIAPLGSNHNFVSAIQYNQANGTSASIVVGLSNTGNTTVNAGYFGLYGTGTTDGTVSWSCGTATALGTTSAAAQSQLYAFLPAPCQQ